MIKAGVFDKLEERSKLLVNLEKLLEWLRESEKLRTNGQRGLFEGMKFKRSVKLTLEKAKPISEQEKLKWEKELLGLYISSHPLNNYRKILEKRAISIKRIIEDLTTPQTEFSSPILRKRIRPGDQVRIGGIISSIKKILTKVGKPMLFLKLEDLSERIEVIVFPSTIEQNPAVFEENKIIFVKGRVDMKDGIPKIIANGIEEIIEN